MATRSGDGDPAIGPTGRMRGSPGLAAVVLAIAGALFLAGVHRVQHKTMDDGYIAFQFARNIAEGHGFVWIAGGEPVEGYTNFLHTVLLAATLLTGADARAANIALGVLAVAGVATLLVTVVRRELKLPPLAVCMALAVYLLDQKTALNTVNGLGTQVFLVTVVAVLAAGLTFLRQPDGRSAAWLFAAVSLCALGRPEGVLTGGAILAILGARVLAQTRGPERSRALRSLSAATGGVLAVGVAYLVWKRSTFGYTLPNSFHVKVTPGGFAGLIPIAGFLRHVFAPLGLVALLAAPFLSLEAVRRLRARPALGWQAALVLIPALLLLAFLATSALVPPRAYRPCQPAYPAAIVLTAAFVSLCGRAARWSQLRFSQGAAFAALLVGWTTLGYGRDVWTSPTRIEPMYDLEEKLVTIADALAETGLGPRATVLFDSAGIVAFRSRFHVVDRVGLVENYLAGRDSPTQDEREDYVWGLPLDVYIGCEPPATPGAERPQSEPLMGTQYLRQLMARPSRGVETRFFAQTKSVLHRRMRELRDDWHLVGELGSLYWEKNWRVKLFAFVRRDSAHFETLVAGLREVANVPPERINLQRFRLPADVRGWRE